MACEELAHKGYRERHLGGRLSICSSCFVDCSFVVHHLAWDFSFPKALFVVRILTANLPASLKQFQQKCRSHANDLERRKAPHNHHNNHNHNHHTSA